MTLAIIAIVVGIALLIWSADRFVEGAAGTANHFGMPPLLVGMIIVGFGTSAPEMVVSAIAAFQGTPGLALGNAYGSNITNIALILGVTALISPIPVASNILRKELPILVVVTVWAAWQLVDGNVSRGEGTLLLIGFAALMGWTVWSGMKGKGDSLGQSLEADVPAKDMSLGKSILWLLIGLVLLIASSRLLVWGAVDIAKTFGVSDLMIGLTIVAIGTSLPELASSIAATRKGEHEIALGNVIGSNLFNTLAVVGIAGSIHPMSVGPEVLSRDVLIMGVLTLSLFVIGYGFGKQGRINRLEGALLTASYVGYILYLVFEMKTA